MKQEIIDTDHRLSLEAETAQQQLAQHRWHWTLDESNPERVSIRQYAREVGKAYTTIHGMVKGYQIKGDRDGPITLTDCIELANLSAERQDEAIAQAQEENRSIAAVIKRPTWSPGPADMEAAEELSALSTHVPFDAILKSLNTVQYELTHLKDKMQAISDESEWAVFHNRMDRITLAVMELSEHVATR